MKLKKNAPKYLAWIFASLVFISFLVTWIGDVYVFPAAVAIVAFAGLYVVIVTVIAKRSRRKVTHTAYKQPPVTQAKSYYDWFKNNPEGIKELNK